MKLISLWPSLFLISLVSNELILYIKNNSRIKDLFAFIVSWLFWNDIVSNAGKFVKVCNKLFN